MSKSEHKYQKIVLATDLANDEVFLRTRAQEMQQIHGATLYAIHVVSTVPSFVDMYGYINADDLNEKLMTDSQNAINKLGSELGIAKEHLIIRQGHAREEIINFAHEIDCDLVIIGSHTRHGLSKLLGSTAHGVVQSAECDTYVVKCPNNHQE